jgi:acetate---CoA ligase (ADP-forming)
MSIQNLFYPRGVAVIGSTSEGKLGWELIRQMLDGGYHDIYAVNPKAQGAFSAPGYPSVVEIERPVDMAVIASPPATVPGVLADCGQAGVGAAAIITAGFSEIGNDAGEAEIQRVARQYGIRFVGPNCAGLVNTALNLYPTLETHPPAGGVAFVAQSGAVGGVVTAWAKAFGLGVSKFVSYGNRADLNEIDFLHYLADDDETEVVGLYIESASGGRPFMEAVQACTACKPVIVIKAGRTQSGQRATLSHTGSLAGADAVYDAALKQCGAIRVHTIEELFDLAKGFVHAPHMRGRKVGIVTNSGGPGVLAADRAEEVGLDVAKPSPATREKLAAFLPPYCALKNPIDLTVEGNEDGYRKTLLAIAGEYDAVLALNIAPPYLDSVPLARGICDAAEQTETPIVAAFLPRAVVADAIDYLEAHGMANFATGERAVSALARMADYGESAKGNIATTVARLRIKSIQRRFSEGKAGEVSEERLPTLEPEAMAWLRENGIPTPPFRFAAASEEAVQGCREIGYPVVMKVVSPQILHKSDVGGVIVGIRDDQQARAAFEKIEAAARGRDFRGVVIYPLIRDAQEVLLGLSRDPQFGPVVAFGLGGIYTEVWRDVALRVAPIDRAEAWRMIREIKSFPLLQGVRGQPPRDLDALVDVLVKFSQLPFRYPQIGEVDLNPVFLLADGLVVGDVRVIGR